MESDVYSSKKAQRKESITQPPNVSEELRIILLGKNGLNSRVGNFILGTNAFDTEAPPPSVEQHSERARGTVEGRYITLINTPHLFDPQLSVEELNQRVRECTTLCSPGPHVLILVLQPDDFTETDRDRLYHILHSLSEDPHKYTLVVTTQKLQPDSSIDPFQEDLVKKIIDECSSTHFEIKRGCSRADLVNVMQILVEKNGGNHVIWETHEAASPATEQGDMEKLEQDNLLPECEVSAFSSKTLKPQLNLVLCGRNREVKASLLDLLLDRKSSKPKIEQFSSVFVRREAEVCGRLITVVELPPLYNSQLSEEEVMRETLHCVSLCDPGVHAFLFIIPAGPLTDEDKGEVEKIQRTFGSRIKENSIVLFTTEFNTDRREPAAWLDSATIQLLSMCEGRYRILEKMENGNLKPVPALVDELVSMATSNKPADPFETECLRIVLIGKTGNGKSATGNSILGVDQFESRANMRGVTSKCQKGFGKVLGKSVAVVDTPGLFDTRFTNKKVTEEIVKCISLSAPGPHAFIIVLSVGRFTKEEMDTVDLIKDIFGPEAVKYSVVLFTRGDELAGETIEEYVQRCGHDDVNKLIKDCGGRVHMFDNKVNNCSQVSELLTKIEDMIQFNRNNYFTNDMLKLAERTIQQKTEEILRERKVVIQNSLESLKKDYVKEVKRNTLHNKREREQVQVGQHHKKKEFEKHMKLLKDKTEKREERKQKELEIKEREREKEQTRTNLRPAAAAEELNHPKQSPKQIIEMFERIIKQEKHHQQSETEQRKKMERENKDSLFQTTKEHENEGQEQKEFEDKGSEEERKMLERLEMEREWQEKLRRREEEEDRMKKEREDEEQMGKGKERKVCEDKESEEERKMMEKLELEREWQEEMRRKEHEDRMKKEREDKEHKEERKERKVCEEDGGEEEWKMTERLELEREWQEELRRREKEDRMRREREKKEHEKMTKCYEKSLNELKIQHEMEARVQAELISDLMPLLEDEISQLMKEHKGKKRGGKGQCVFL